MAKRRGRKSVDHAQFIKYRKTAEHFYYASKDSIELEYWTAAGVLIVHSAIAYADALCVKLSGQKSTGENHEDVIYLLEKAVADSKGKNKAVNQLKRIIEEKTKVSYLGELYSPSQTDEMWRRLERFREWANSLLDR